jgi:predicted ATPase
MKTATTMDSSTYPFNIPALKDLGQLDFHPRITFFVGENGSGKSTLLEALAMSMTALVRRAEQKMCSCPRQIPFLYCMSI